MVFIALGKAFDRMTELLKLILRSVKINSLKAILCRKPNNFFTVTLLLAGCETKHSETKDQLGKADQDTAVMARGGQVAGDAGASAANA